jgi:hypothetical protein
MTKRITEPRCYRKLEIPPALRTQSGVAGQILDYGGDVRLGDLTGDGRPDLLVYRAVDDAHDGGGLKPAFLGAFTLEGEVLWTAGSGGVQPSRPGPVVVYDIDGDGAAEVLTFFATGTPAASDVMANVVIQVRDGPTGSVMRQAAPPALQSCAGSGPNWVHQRLLIANFRGTPQPRDLVVKLGARVLAFDADLDLLWPYTVRWNDYGRCAAYIPAVGDVDGDGRDEVNGGYFLLNHDGIPLWEHPWAPHMDSVAIASWDGGRMRAICSGGGHVIGATGDVILALGEDLVPHGQEVRVARFDPDDSNPQMVIRWNGHHPDVRVVDTSGHIVNAFRLNDSPNQTGMEVVYWHGFNRPALLYNGGRLWDPIRAPDRAASVALPGLPDPAGPARMGWYHCIPADVCGDGREEVVLYNPWDRWIFIYTPAPLDETAYRGYVAGPRQYNARLMD